MCISFAVHWSLIFINIRSLACCTFLLSFDSFNFTTFAAKLLHFAATVLLVQLSLLHLLPFCAALHFHLLLLGSLNTTTPTFSSLNQNSQGNMIVLQALTMDRHLGSSFKIPAGTVAVVVLISTCIFLVIFDRFLLPTWQKLTNRVLTPLQRIGIGHDPNFHLYFFVCRTFILANTFYLAITPSFDLVMVEHYPYGYLNAKWDFSNNTEGSICWFMGLIAGSRMKTSFSYYYFFSYCVPWTQGKNKSEVPWQIVLNLILQRKNKRKQTHQMKETPSVELLHEESKEMGTTCRAVLPSGWFLAVKRLLDTRLFDEHFITKLKTLGRLRDEKLKPLLGFFIHSEEKLLVYKYMSKGSLYDWLHLEEGEARFMEWPLSVKIAIGAATGLVWVHQGCNFHVFHLDISSKCILLDKNFVPKLSNFGEAMLMKPHGTDSTKSFSLNTEFWESSFAKEDVYCFGILLLELITREDPRSITTNSNTSNETLNNWVTHLSASSNFYSIVNKALMGQGFDQEIFQFLKVALDWEGFATNPCGFVSEPRRWVRLETQALGSSRNLSAGLAANPAPGFVSERKMRGFSVYEERK
ncbi:hypothetical protein SLEP1_g13732 [Rubroshorea leprosula]|uniref:Protein kinase domain-containing protein n=1 Tax=Rubroshorea leprosula TaxID=152421 RepID=A0AAV5IQQ1_9ROSI|nr:hypothetical protein SLEP1_g13732 [Rubroshorea leprosula]